MIPGNKTEKVFLSQIIKDDERYKATTKKLINILNQYNIEYDFLKHTRDIWCRDYMPIQKNENEFVQFKYEPSYLDGFENLRTIPKQVCEVHDIKTIESNINLDGGNIINWEDKAILTDRVFDENMNTSSKLKLIQQLENLLEVEVILVPQIISDMTGHIDGMMRFVDKNTLIGNNRSEDYKYVRAGINKVLKEHGLNYIDAPFFDYKNKKHPDNAIGCYMNYLEVEDLIVLPGFEVKGNKDQEALDLMCEIFPDRKIATINYNEIGHQGGLLNCTTWAI